MGKLGVALLFILMIDVVGFLAFTAAAEEGVGIGSGWAGNNTMLQMFYTPTTDASNHTIYMIQNDSVFYQSVPVEPGEGFSTGSFIDRIFVLFKFLRFILVGLLVPVQLVMLLGIPYQLTMLLIVPLCLFYVLGIIDIVSGGNS